MAVYAWHLLLIGLGWEFSFTVPQMIEKILATTQAAQGPSVALPPMTALVLSFTSKGFWGYG